MGPMRRSQGVVDSWVDPSVDWDVDRNIHLSDD